MEGLANKWKTLLQSQSAEDIKFSRMTASRKEEPSSKQKESAGGSSQQLSGGLKDPRSKSRDKNKNSRLKSNEKKGSTKQIDNRSLQAETPLKMMNSRQQKILERYTNSLIDLAEDGVLGIKQRAKIKALLEDLIMTVPVQINGTSSLRVSVGDRAYLDLEQRYIQSEKQRQYLKGKMEIMVKRSEGLEREVERYGKLEKLIDSSINRENQLRQEINRLKIEKTELEATMKYQNQVFESQVESIRGLLETLKSNIHGN